MAPRKTSPLYPKLLAFLFILILGSAHAVPLDGLNSFIKDSINPAHSTSSPTDSKIAESATAIIVPPQTSPSASAAAATSDLNTNIGDTVLPALSFTDNVSNASTVIVTITPPQGTVTSTILSTTIIKPSLSIVTLTVTI